MGAAMRRHRTTPSGWTLAMVLCALGALLVAPGLTVGAPASRSASSPPIQATIQGPSVLGISAKATFYFTAHGGPAEASNGSTTGNLSYHASLIGGNTSSGLVAPPQGVFVNNTANVTVQAPNITGNFELEVEVTSFAYSNKSDNASQNFTAAFTVVLPYSVNAVLQNPNNFTVSHVEVQVQLDGTVVGNVSVPSMAPQADFDLHYNYSTLSLTPGWHTFTLEIMGPPGLLLFSTGSPTESISFYVTPPPVDYTPYYLGGAGVAVAAIFISTLILGPRRGRRKKST